MTGYLHPLYAASFAEWGKTRELPQSGGWVIERDIPETNARDAMGCYPVFACRDWHKLGFDLDAIGLDLVSLTLVTDPFADVTDAGLRTLFPDLARPYKAHFVADLSVAPKVFVHPHHLRNATSARRSVQVRQGPPTPELLCEWVTLYTHLIDRHNIRGITAFSEAAFAAQFRVPGLVVDWAELDGVVVGMVLWYMCENRAYYHLGAYSDAGYAAKCSFAIFLTALERFAADGVRWVSLGAGAGAANDGTDGLSRFKRGWANETRLTYLCGSVFDVSGYHALRRSRKLPDEGYFPAYRAGEFR